MPWIEKPRKKMQMQPEECSCLSLSALASEWLPLHCCWLW